jgi:hypothetical protein
MLEEFEYNELMTELDDFEENEELECETDNAINSKCTKRAIIENE